MELRGAAAKQLNLRFDALQRDLDGFAMKWRDLCRAIDSVGCQAHRDAYEQQKIVDEFKNKLIL